MRENRHSTGNSNTHQPYNNLGRKLDIKNTSVRTLFIRNIAYEVTEEDILDIFSKFGEIKRSFSLIKDRGIAFITFYDIRASERAFREINNTKIGKRTVEVHYSTPKGNTNQNHCTTQDNQGTLFLTLSGNILIEDIAQHFSTYGEVMDVRNLRDGHRNKFVEFYDSRDCVKAYQAIKDTKLSLGDIEITCEISWDIGAKNLVKQEKFRKGKSSSDQESFYTNQHASSSHNAYTAQSAATVPSNLALQAILSAATQPKQIAQGLPNISTLATFQSQPQIQVSPQISNNTNQQLQVLQQLYALQSQLNGNK
eukprot:NODE_136_length_16465_cov_1.184957.p8 type:complete len:310 gc:universal NODE_136_length_16465_cov_1.184957:7940-7011(-)